MTKKAGMRVAGPVMAFILAACIFLSGAEIETGGLKSGTFAKKVQIIDRIVNTGSKVYLPQLGAVLDEDSNEEIRSRAALALLTIGDSTCIQYFKKALEDTYWQVRLYGIQGIVKYGEGDMIPSLKSAMKDSYWQVRYYAAVGFSKYGNETVVPDLAGYARDTNEKVNEQVLWALMVLMRGDEARAAFKKLPEDRIKPVLDKTKSSSPEMRIRSLWLLESTGDRRAIPYFIGMLADSNDEIKIRALWALEKFKSEDGGREIESLMADESVRVKIESIKTLVNLKMEEGMAGLIRGLTDRNESVKIYSLWALEKFRNPVSYPAIAESLADSSEDVREYAARLIEKLHDPLFLPVLQRFVEDETFPLDARLSALRIMGRTGDGSVKQFVMGKTEDSDALVRYAGMKSLYDLDRFDPDCLKTLTYLENNDVSPRVKSEAANLLNSVVKEMGARLNNPDRSERTFVLDRIDSLVGAKELPALLLNMASSKYPEVREKMLVTVREEPDRIFARSAREMFKESDVSMKRLAALALGEIRDREAVALLREGMKSRDPETQLICAWALARIGTDEGILPVAVAYLESRNTENQTRAAETLGLLGDKRGAAVLLKRMADSELDVKLVCAWALARMGDERGMEMLVRLSEESIEPVRTSANVYLEDASIPQDLRSRIPAIREKIHFERLGIREVSPRIASAGKITGTIEIDGADRERFWQTAEKESMFIEVPEDKIVAAAQTRVAIGYDENNVYFLFVCDDPDTSKITLNSRDFITLSVNPLNTAREWYQFVIHPLGHVKYSYVWKLYSDSEPERSWTSGWKAETKIENRRYLVELAVPLKDLKIDKISRGDVWSINFQRESEHVPLTSWSGRIDNPEQFGILRFKP